MQFYKIKRISTLIGSLLLHFMIGSGNTFANLNTYITSYLRENGSKDANYGQSVWYTAVGVTTFTLLTIFSGFIVKKIGTRITCLFGTLILWFVNYILIIITTN
jgi:MFS family permease